MINWPLKVFIAITIKELLFLLIKESEASSYQHKLTILEEELARAEDRIHQAKQHQAESEALQGQTESYVSEQLICL